VLICPICESVFPDGMADRCPHDESPLYVVGDDIAARKALGPGDIVASKYELIEEIEQRGGAGRTFRARQIHLEREVELRLLPENTITKPSDHARFRREVETWGRLRDDHLVRLYDSGFAEGNAPYMALEYFASGSAGDHMRLNGRLPVSACETIARHCLRALDAAHREHVLHRNISPNAIILEVRPDGSVHSRLTGFGLAKHLDDGDEDPTAITMTGQVVGNPAYMAPETIMRGTLDPRTDLYSLGVTIYELLTGARPFTGKSLAEMLAAHVTGTAVPLSRHRSDISPSLQGLVERLIDREPIRRYQTADEALVMLEFQSERSDWTPIGEPLSSTPSTQWRQWALFAVMGLAIFVAALILTL